MTTPLAQHEAGFTLRRAAAGVMRFTVALAVLAAAGCKVDQDHEVSLYRDILDAKAAPASSPPAADDPLPLTAALQLANRNNEQLGLRGEDYVQALIAKNRAVAAFLPTVSLQPSYSVTTAVSLGALRTGESSKRFQLPIVGEINLFNGGGDAALVEAAKATIAQRRELLLDVQATVLLNVAQVYYQILRSERQVQVLTHSLSLQQARLTDIEARVRNGLGTALDQSQSKARADATAVSLTRARNDAAVGRALLARLIGIPAVRGPLTNQLAIPAAVEDEAAFEKRGVAQRQDLRAAADAIQAARKNVDVAFAQYYPSVSLNTAAFLQPDFFTSAVHWNAVLVANVPIFTAGIIHADVRAAWSKLRQAALDQVGVQRQVALDVQTSHANFTSNEQVRRGLQSQVDAAAQAYELSRKGYVNGLAINLDVLTAQDELLLAQLQLASADFDRAVFYLDLLRAAGEMDLSATLPLPAPDAPKR